MRSQVRRKSNDLIGLLPDLHEPPVAVQRVEEAEGAAGVSAGAVAAAPAVLLCLDVLVQEVVEAALRAAGGWMNLELGG